MKRRVFLGVALAAPMALCGCLANRQALRVCKGNSKGEQCRYLGEDEEGHACLKLSPEHRRIIDEEVARFVRHGMADADVPLGNNCSGVSPHERLV